MTRPLFLGILACFAAGFVARGLFPALVRSAHQPLVVSQTDRSEEMRQLWAREYAGKYDPELFQHFALFFEYDRLELFRAEFGPLCVAPLGVSQDAYLDKGDLMFVDREKTRTRLGELNSAMPFPADPNRFQLLGLYVLGELRLVYGKQTQFPLPSFFEWAYGDLSKSGKIPSSSKLLKASPGIEQEILRETEHLSRLVWPIIQDSDNRTEVAREDLLGFAILLAPASRTRPTLRVLRKGEYAQLDRAVAELEKTELEIRKLCLE